MGIDVRFYYASLVAVLIFFLMGLLIGIGLSRQPAVEKLAAHIEKQLRQYREEVNKQLRAREQLIRSLQSELANMSQRMTWHEQFLRAAAPMLLSGVLQHRNIAVVVTAPESDIAFLNDLKLMLSAADGTVRSVTRIHRVAFTMSEDAIARLASKLSVQPAAGVHDLRSAYRKALIAKLAQLIRFGDQNDQLRKYVHGGWTTISGDYSHPVGAVIFISAVKALRDQSEFEAIDIELVRALKVLGAKVVVCETSGVEKSIVPVCRHVGVPTVDNAESAIGQICIVYALAGQEGNYGWKETARTRFPDLRLGNRAVSAQAKPAR
ncbi:MAG: copper transporter [Armatimonadota bacterium]|nr:copper transporter [Armatimonadota bacterium]MCX7776857.1 copper transporter [Armatimonadota bacterium]MDW8024457.1 copper transporter [Armatimonadota bacterium]